MDYDIGYANYAQPVDDSNCPTVSYTRQSVDVIVGYLSSWLRRSIILITLLPARHCSQGWHRISSFSRGRYTHGDTSFPGLCRVHITTPHAQRNGVDHTDHTSSNSPLQLRVAQDSPSFSRGRYARRLPHSRDYAEYVSHAHNNGVDHTGHHYSNLPVQPSLWLFLVTLITTDPSFPSFYIIAVI